MNTSAPLTDYAEIPAATPRPGNCAGGEVSSLMASRAPSIIEQMKATAAAENKAAREAWPDWDEGTRSCGKHGKARPMKLDPEDVAQKRADGWTQQAIADLRGVSLATVQYCIRKMESTA